MRFNICFVTGTEGDTNKIEAHNENDTENVSETVTKLLPVYRTPVNDISEVISDDNEKHDDPYFVSVHQLVEVTRLDTAVLECTITNIDPSITVSLVN